MCLGSSTCMHNRTTERAISRSMTSPMTGIMPMTADHPNRPPQQQQLRERSMEVSMIFREEGGNPYDMLVHGPF
jgi:hypothetical protein